MLIKNRIELEILKKKINVKINILLMFWNWKKKEIVYKNLWKNNSCKGKVWKLFASDTISDNDVEERESISIKKFEIDFEV